MYISAHERAMSPVDRVLMILPIWGLGLGVGGWGMNRTAGAKRMGFR